MDSRRVGTKIDASHGVDRDSRVGSPARRLAGRHPAGGAFRLGLGGSLSSCEFHVTLGIAEQVAWKLFEGALGDQAMTEQAVFHPLRQRMHELYGVAPAEIRFVYAPYRICPLGSHIDHQLGTVTAMTINQGVHVAFAASGTREVRLGSLSFPGEVRFAVDRVPARIAGDWGNYARGAAAALAQGHALKQGILGVTHGAGAKAASVPPPPWAWRTCWRLKRSMN